MLRRAVTLKDIAAETGVHPSTVSRALDPKLRQAISQDLVDTIVAAAQRMGYRPNRIASSLRTNRSMTIGVVLPDISNWIFPPIVRGIESILEEEAYTPIIVNTDNLPAREERQLAVLRERGVDGIIHAAALRDAPAITALAEQGLPVVTLNRKIQGTSVPYVINDEHAGIRMMVETLVANGHSQIAAISGPQTLSTGQMRQEALLATLASMGLDQPACIHAVAHGFSEAEGRRCAADLFERGNHFTAILCANDRLALGAMAEMSARGLSCPDDISLTGFNDMPFLDMIRPGLTTVRIEQYESGREAAKLLLRIIRGDKDVPVETVMPVQMIARESVKPPARRPAFFPRPDIDDRG